jgi:transketolase
MRNAMQSLLFDMAERDPNLVVVIDDTGFQVFEEFEKKFPGQFYNVGIAEQQFVGLAAGLALEGMHVVLYNICNFYIRSMEQIRMDLALQNLGVVLIGIGGGLHYGAQGPTHNGTEDLSLFRAMPNMRVICPADPVEMQSLFSTAVKEQKLTYIRLCKNNDPILYTGPIDIQIGKAVIMREGKDAAIIATGGMVRDALETARLLANEGIETRVVSMHTVKPADDQMIIECAGFPALFTMEENNKIGGLGSCAAEVMANAGVFPKSFRMFGLPDCFPLIAGTRDYLNAQFGMDAISMANTIRSVISAPPPPPGKILSFYLY